MLTQEICPHMPHFVHMDDTVRLSVTKEDKTIFFDWCIYYSTTTIKKVIADEVFCGAGFVLYSVLRVSS